MPQYFFHLRTARGLTWDEEGIDLPDPMTAKGAADKTAAELRGGLLHEARPGSCWTVVLTDETGEILHLVSC